jgi:transcriptional regulator with GAF, ATPase, and Fis domain
MTSGSTQPLVAPRELLRLDESGRLLVRKYRLAVIQGPDQGRTALVESTLQLGSSESAGFFLKDKTVSKRHVELTARPDGVLVRDLDSRNGTFSAGIRLREALLEVAPDRPASLTIGRTELSLQVVEQDLGAPKPSSNFGRAIGNSPVMQQLFGLLQRVASSDVTVMLLGETGTGKELLAESIHQASGRKDQQLVVFDCAGVAPSLIESELFGHVKGAFTGADQDREGAFLRADGGTMFLDEIGELPLDLQPKLLRALECQTVRRVGEDRERRVNVRIIAATHRDLEQEVADGRFRQDLYFRLAVVPVQVPSLRERPEDIPLLVKQMASQLKGSGPLFTESVLKQMAAWSWPGNVRELRNAVQRVAAGGPLELKPPRRTTSSSIPKPSNELPFHQAKEQLLEQFTREYLLTLMKKCDGNVAKMARTAGVARTHLHRMLTLHGIKPERG